LPPGLRESDRLPEPIFTPAAKINTDGHDENISFEDVIAAVGAENANALRELTLGIFEKAAAHAESRGLILADTKFEFGVVDGEIILADEVLTPDSSRYWPAESYSPGGAQPSFDKQYVRDYLESIRWNKQAPAPSLPEEVIEKTRAKYLEAFRLITGRSEL
jgi:phosphoribosylaminoimidazole-succinocarboxamide synthase